MIWEIAILASAILISPVLAQAEELTEKEKKALKFVSELTEEECQALKMKISPSQTRDGASLEFLKAVEIHGFLDTYYSYNFNKPTSRTTIGGGETNRFHAFDLEDNSLTVDNFELQITKPVSSDSRAGFALYTNYGEIAQRIVFAKHATKGRADDDDFTVSVAYANYLADIGSGLDIKVGRIPTWIGAEVWESVWNCNWSRSLLYQNAIPFTHTGLSLGYKFNDNFSANLYGVNGWDTFQDNNNSKTYGVRLAADSKKASFYINTIHGNENDEEFQNRTRHLFDFILDLRPVDKLRVNINFDTGSEAKTNHWQGLATVVAYDFTDYFGLALRGEYLREAASAGANMKRTGVTTQSAVELYETTLTANIKLGEKIFLRPEFRRDWSKDKVFKNNAKYSQEILSCSVAYMF
ncbi:MAG: porin [Candidatus Schekmanbacteria bacterium]|nr:porin [Candidatus Schekmanbacteria bacterium]